MITRASKVVLTANKVVLAVINADLTVINVDLTAINVDLTATNTSLCNLVFVCNCVFIECEGVELAQYDIQFLGLSLYQSLDYR
ncbi:purine nucleoside phosphorylase [Vibrio splendidus 12B01]|nr:purine nucleoside phosphorylase [Vibrio splendidus 12B01]